MSQGKFLLFKQGLKSYFKIRIPNGHEVVCRDSGIHISFSCNFCCQFILFIYRERLRNGGRYVLARKHRSSIHNESIDDDVTADDAAKGGNERDEASRTSNCADYENVSFASPFHGLFDELKEFISL